ncbi:class II fumarate hydratase [Brochothrix thermosphacta]|uniref:class II fumarate hydratase n=1 Tax=Brochothrix thermosphacta TaxID=2756 RepID=UPI0003E8654C|nr:class II fumarate hydratase [Brochothrix thermosphacta]SLM93212.1 Fumarate hydratase class II [Brachybacterium faecium]EUJ35750.1 fumarate hydratase [Brochothrix thermosphacta DSM 20171 = FSL F6-1036]MDO7863544.1 class II fumarate hydratase [Brochothrix thermosphacta]ODJ50787.1 fumarate hydratase, class II [Brochothrix thermosphacta DSM 20171 = FSL F6-1036]ODJ52598.1 fumarate hydratase, class II [Brochothrix thermosphacta]
MNVRIEKDTMGTIEVPADHLWGAQTQRSFENFKIGDEKMPVALIIAFAELKKAASVANYQLGKLSQVKQAAIATACDEIIAGKWPHEFPLSVWQTGSGTQTNMNMNEVIAFRANLLITEENVHPNDDVNMSQSSNDTFPTAMHIAAYRQIHAHLLPIVKEMTVVLTQKKTKYQHLVKIGRTHLQDATPLTFGQEISGWEAMMNASFAQIEQSAQTILELAIGGTAVGTGLNADPRFGDLVATQLAEQTGYPFISAANKFHALTSHDALVYTHGAIKGLAANAMKIANDIRFLASGPRSGFGELSIPANEPGSSIMPGKVNPTQSEALTMVAVQVMGNDATVGIAASQGNFELNVYKPVIIYNVLQSVGLLADALDSFNRHCLIGLEALPERMNELVEQSLMLVTALNPYIGYEKAAEIAKKAFADNSSLRAAALATGYVTETQYNEWIDPLKMVNLPEDDK